MKVLTQGENNPHWHIPKYCKHCNQNNIKYTKLHRILECPKQQNKRKTVLDSVITELNFYENKYHNINNGRCTIIPPESYQLLLDAAATGSIRGFHALQQTLITLTGGNINPNLKDAAQQQISKMMVSHLYLLINIFTNNIAQPNNWIKLPNGQTIAKEDIEQGKILVRTQTNNDTQYTNIRASIEALTIPQIHHYNVGIGTAQNRTDKQTIMAKRYTQHIINQSSNHIILTDASINTKNDPRTAIQKKIEKTGYGG